MVNWTILRVIMTIAKELAHYIVELKFSDLSQETIDQTKMCILDWIGVALRGGRQELVQILMETVMTSGGTPECTIIGNRTKASCLNAALINGTMSYAVKLDQSSPHGSIVHPQPPMIPAALAVSEWKELPGKDFIIAVLLGFEIEVRIAMAVNPSHTEERGFHTTGTCGTLGAATAAGKLMKLSNDQMVQALGIAGTQAAGLRISLETPSRSLHAGKAAHSGILAAMLAKEGFIGAEGIFEEKGGFCQAMSDNYDLSKLTDGLGQRYLISDQRFVRYASGGAIHAAIDAVIELKQTHGIQTDDIDLIDARTFPMTIDLCGIQEPKTFEDAQFSLPFILAIAAIDGQVGLEQLTEKRLTDPKVMAVAKRVKGSADPEFTALGYSGSGDLFQSAKVTIRTHDGKEYYQQVDVHKGCPQNPFTKEELLEKFRSLSSIVLPKSRVEEIIEVVENLEKLDSMSKLAKLLCP
jgi:2-methylcitrate dehydratase PrpD